MFLYSYVVGDDRVLFTLNDGSKAWEVKNFLIKQERCLLVTIEGKDYFGKGHHSGQVVVIQPAHYFIYCQEHHHFLC